MTNRKCQLVRNKKSRGEHSWQKELPCQFPEYASPVPLRPASLLPDSTAKNNMPAMTLFMLLLPLKMPFLFLPNF